MKVETNGIKIELEQEEIVDLWNIIMFALDWQNYATKNGKSMMTESELKLAKELELLLDKIR